MINKYFTYALAAAAALLTSCADAPDAPTDGTTQLTLLSPAIAATTVETRSMPVDGTTFPWQPRDHRDSPGTYYYYDYPLSLWICDKGTYNPHFSGYCNFAITITSYNNGIIRWLVNDQQYYSMGMRLGRSVDIYAYYPYVKNVDNPEAVPFTTTEQKDWMWATPKTIDNISEGSEDNKLKPVFHHAMTCIEVRLSTLYEGTVNLNSITLSDAKSQLTSGGTMNITNGSLTYIANQPSITIKGNNYNSDILPTTGDGTLSYCFLMPEKEFEAGDLSMTFYFDAAKTPGRTVFTMPTRFKNSEGNTVDVTKLETGKKYVLNLVIDNALTIRPISCSKEDWTTVDVDLKI